MELGDARRVVRRRRDDGADRLGRAEHVAHDARLDDARAERGRHLVAAPHHDERVGRQSRGLAQPRRDRAERRVRLHDRGEPLAIDAVRVAGLGRPRARARVEQTGRRRVGRIDGEHARRAPRHPRAGQQERRRGGGDVRLVVGQPAIFGATWLGSILQPVSARSSASSTRAATSSHSSPARRSHQMSAGRSTLPSARAATSPSSCEPNDSAAIVRPAHASRTLAQGADERPQPFVAVLLGPARPRIGELVRARSSRPRASRRARAPVRMCPANRRRRRPREARSCARERTSLRYGAYGKAMSAVAPIAPSRRATPARARRCRLGARRARGLRTAWRSCSRAAACAAWSRRAWSPRWSGSE